MNTPVFNKIIQIESALARYKYEDISLISGSMGVAIFYAELFDLTKSKGYQKKAKKIIAEVIESLSEVEITHTLANGFTGVAWGINYLAKKGLIQGSSNELFESLDPYIYRSGIDDIRIGQYDLLHGAIGAALFALERLPDPNALAFLKEFVQEVDRIKHEDEHGFKWEDAFTRKYHPETKDLYSFGQAHGIPSIAAILLKIFMNGIFQSETSRLVTGTINWMIQHRSPYCGTQSFYPTFASSSERAESQFSSRLAWCYGDLPIALLFLNAGKIFQEQRWLSEFDAIIEHSRTRRDPLNDPNLDGGFCHGTAGIAYLFRKFHRKTGNPTLLSRADFWIHETLNKSVFDNALAGYKTFIPKTKEQWVDDAGLLTGIAGIGLTLIDSLRSEETQWDECLLL